MKANIDLKDILVLHVEDYTVIINYRSGLAVPFTFSYLEAAKSFYEKVNTALIDYRESNQPDWKRYLEV